MIREPILFRPFFSLLLLLSFSPFCTYEPTSQIHPSQALFLMLYCSGSCTIQYSRKVFAFVHFYQCSLYPSRGRQLTLDDQGRIHDKVQPISLALCRFLLCTAAGTCKDRSVAPDKPHLFLPQAAARHICLSQELCRF